MRGVAKRAEELASTDEPTIPSGLVQFLEEAPGNDGRDFSGVDKAATPAERVRSEAQLEREMERQRPQTLVPQRDSDAKRDVASSRESARSEFSTLSIQSGPNLIDQFKASYILRVFCTSLPWCVGGPDFRQQSRWRRHFEDAPRCPSTHAQRCWPLVASTRSVQIGT